MPEKKLKKIYTYILPQWKYCFFTAVVTGLVSHLYKITGWLPNWDSLVFRVDSQNMVALGRWFLPVVCSLSSFYDLPFLNGIIAIVFHALGAACICRILDINKIIPACLIGALTASFPTVTSVMMYNYVADGYSVAFFLSVAAAYYMTAEKPGIILPAVLIALSAGIYQAYLTVTVMLVLYKLIDEIVFKGENLKILGRKIFRMLLTGISGVLLYGIILKTIMCLFSVELLDYQGINSSASLSEMNLAGSLYVIKETFIKFFFDLSGGLNFYIILNVFILLFTIIFYVKYSVKNELYKKPLYLCTIVFLGAMLIIGAGILAFANAEIDYHNLMLMGYSVFYMFFLGLYERGDDSSEKTKEIKCWCILITALLLIANQVVIANVSYHKAQIAYEKTNGMLIRIADRIEQTPGYDNCEKILVVGALENSEKYSVNLNPEITGITDGYIIRADDETVHQSVLCSALSDYCELNYEFISGEEKKKLLTDERIKSMNEWPKDGSIAVLDNILIVKLSSEGLKK